MASAEQPDSADHAVDKPGAAKGRKFYVPLENNPDVMNSLVYKLGLSRSLAFQDVFSIDEPELLAFVPRPAHALLLIFPTNERYHNFRQGEDADKPEYAGSGATEPVVWYKQTIGNACGLMGVLHAVSNFPAAAQIEPGSDLAKLLSDAIPLSPQERAKLIYDSPALESAHNTAAVTGDTSAPQAEADVDLHFVCFVKTEDGHLWEMDGARKGPIDRGQLPAGEDVLGEKALELGPRAFMKREAEAEAGDPRFSLIVLAPSMD